MISTKRAILKIIEADKADLLLKYYLNNKHHLSPWEPIRAKEYFTLKNFKNLVASAQTAYQEGREYKFTALSLDQREVIGVCNFTGVCKGPFQACFLGYSISKKYEGKGYMHEILKGGIEFIFNEIGLNRIMANYIPQNERSRKLLQRLGFEREGYARRYLKIAGKWEDHILTAKINESY